MLFYVSCADHLTGQFLGGVFVNRPTESEAAFEAVRIAHEAVGGARCPRCFETVAGPVPQDFPVPANAIGRLLTKAELATIGKLTTLSEDQLNSLRWRAVAPHTGSNLN